MEQRFDVPFVGALALREKQVQQNYRPIIAVHKWFARRPGTLFRGLLLAELGDKPVAEAFFRSNTFAGKRVADPFMGGGTPLIEANRLGCDVVGWDINPMAWWIVRQEIEHLDLAAYRKAAALLLATLETEVGKLYRTTCVLCGAESAHVKYFLWVKTLPCTGCGKILDLFPGYLVAEDRRHPRNVLLCPGCGCLCEVADRHRPGDCHACGHELAMRGPAGRSSCPCPSCHTANTYPRPSAGAPQHRLFAMEYLCRGCRPHHRGRFFKVPDTQDLARAAKASARWAKLGSQYVPDDVIPAGDETDRLHRWGYRHYREMFNERQLLGLELSAQHIAAVADERVRNALATNLSDLLRYQNMLCRYDTMALKSLDIFSVHGFPVGLVVCESNLLGIAKGDGSSVGSGGWSNITDKYARAKAYCDAPFEVTSQGGVKIQVAVPGEWIGERRNGTGPPEIRDVKLHAGSATEAELPDGSLDAVLTDPPYFGNVQYAELMDFCYVWLRRLATPRPAAFDAASTRNPDELTGNATMSRDLAHFTEGLATVFGRMTKALKPGAPLAFTYHHNKLEAYVPVAVAILDAGLVCTATLPCPAEMGASIHIAGTGSSVVDTVFVCRGTGTIQRRLTLDTAEGIARLAREDLVRLEAAGLKPTRGDIRCIVYGHLVRLAIWRLRSAWDKSTPTSGKSEAVGAEIRRLGGATAPETILGKDFTEAPFAHAMLVGETTAAYAGESDAISF
jgi:adenine-specific DNA methylase